ncbi:alpha/beta fold hydrolase [Nocardia sp. ET3-3]|uniref:Alpha/beta fold hydrolase n=1 Tax=Nocardia terrae TaxID=2675851 RepID=A0A7K1UXT2_9NOCA|nr:alpha/beta fold hydrolase [Nocardia terrae]MVU79112.1 alpha/beta fold hydrolase [Nocardia terrae]
MPFAPVTLGNGPSDVEYLVTGSGPGVVLVHGTFADAEAQWTELMAELGSRYTVVAPNLAGSGATTHPAEMTVEDLAAQVLAAADHAGLATFHLAGHSLGAVTAAALAGLRPGRVNSLVLHAPWAAPTARGAGQFGLWLDLLRTDRDALARLLPLCALKPETMAAWTTEDFDQTVAAFAGLIDPRHAVQVELDRVADIRALLPRITAPTRVLASLQDHMVPVAEQRAVAAAIAGAELVEFDAGHALPLEDGPGFGKAVAEFLDRHTAR